MAKVATKEIDPGIKSALYTSDPAFFFNHFNERIPNSYLRATEKLASPVKPKFSSRQKLVESEPTIKIESKPGATKNAPIKAELPEFKGTDIQKKAAKSSPPTRKKKDQAPLKLDLRKTTKSSAGKSTKKITSIADGDQPKSGEVKDVSVSGTRATLSRAKKSTVVSNSILISTKKTSRKQIKEEGQISKFASWLQKLDAPSKPGDDQKTQTSSRSSAGSQVKKVSKPAKATKPSKQKKISGTKTKNIDKSIKLSEDIISETLADLLAKQGHTDAAKEMYEKLSLINPGKSGLFASKIEKLLK